MSPLAPPAPTPESRPYWEGCARGELRMPRCLSCRRLHFFPRSFCPHCWSETLAWETLSGRGTVASLVRSHRAPDCFDLVAPFVVALVEVEEGVRLMSNIVGRHASSTSVGDAVQIEFGGTPDGIALPRFEHRATR